MASIGSDTGGRKRILFVAPDGSRKTIRLGKADRKTAESVSRHVEALLAAQLSGQPIERQAASWLGTIGEDLHDRLARAGLVEAKEQKQRPTVGGIVEEFLASRTDLKPGTMVNLRQAAGLLVKFLGASKPIEDVTEADAENFYRSLLDDGQAHNTARRRTGRAKQFFAYAIKKRLITVNPFAVVKVATCGNRDRQEYVPVDTIRVVLDTCPSTQWRLIVALSRFAGLRCPSEHLALSWGDICWDRMRFTVRSPKTEHIPGKESRVVPITPELYPYLRDAFEEAEPGQQFVITTNRVDGGMLNGITTNWRTQLLRIIKRAGLTVWPRLTHSLRASCQVDLSNRFPEHVVCAWLGNSVEIAREHYLSVTEDHFQQAAQKAAQQATESDSTDWKAEKPQAVKPLVLQQSAASRENLLEQTMTLRGSEHPHDSKQETALHESGGTESGTLAQLAALWDHLSPADRQAVLALAERLARAGAG